jgi:hypothetical protein
MSSSLSIDFPGIHCPLQGGARAGRGSQAAALFAELAAAAQAADDDMVGDGILVDLIVSADLCRPRVSGSESVHQVPTDPVQCLLIPLMPVSALNTSLTGG